MKLTDKAREDFLATHASQVEKGIETYGQPLTPFNGRSAYKDALEEAADLVNYIAQLEAEREELETQFTVAWDVLTAHGLQKEYWKEMRER
jgi:hypothetical protein